MSDERSFGIDMVPLVGSDDAWGELYRSTNDGIREQALSRPTRAPVTEVEPDESVNADALRRACHARIAELIAHVRGLDPRRNAIVVSNIVRLAAQDLEVAIERYLAVERKFPRS